MSIRKHIDIIEAVKIQDFDPEKSEREANQWREQANRIKELASHFTMSDSSDCINWVDKHVTFKVWTVSFEELLELSKIAHNIRVDPAYSDDYVSLVFTLND